MTTTNIKNADWVIAWNSEKCTHEYLRNADVVFEGKSLKYVGHSYTGEVDEVVDANGKMVMPGLLNMHSHAFWGQTGKGFQEDLASKQWHMSQLYEYTILLNDFLDENGFQITTQAAIRDMLLSGCTTFTELYVFTAFPPFPNWLETLAKTGIRTFICPQLNSGNWFTPNGREIVYDFSDEKKGLDNIQKAVELIEEAESHSSGRFAGMMGCAQVDTSTEELFTKVMRVAKDRGIQVQTHASQSVPEFHEMLRRYGKTPIEWMQSIGVLDEDMLIGHCINIDQHPLINHHEHKDLERLAESGATVVHCPRAFAQWGDALHSLGAYLEAGVNVALGTDAGPHHDMIEEMRIAGLVSKVVSRHVDLLKTKDVFDVATVRAANAVKRPDLGRLAVGCKADIVLVDLQHPSMVPARDPLKSFIYNATTGAVCHVYVDGELVVKDGQVITMDNDEITNEMHALQKRVLATVADRDWANRDADEIAPLALAMAEKK